MLSRSFRNERFHSTIGLNFLMSLCLWPFVSQPSPKSSINLTALLKLTNHRCKIQASADFLDPRFVSTKAATIPSRSSILLVAHGNFSEVSC
jgi:hypothetical protein